MTLFLALVVAACGGASPAAPAASPAPAHPEAAAVVAPPGAPLPAGDWSSGHNYATCWDCPTPAAVVVLDVYGDPAAAERAVAAVPAGVLPLGYPMAVHTDELALRGETREGIALVLGQFATPAQAEAWRAQAASVFPQARTLPLAQGEDVWTAWDNSPQRRVVRIQAGDPVPAFAMDDVEAFLAATECREYGGDSDGPCPPFPDARPLCMLPGGSIFVVRDADIGGFYYRWLPVRCGDRPAAVAWRWTLFAATIFRRADGSYLLRQTVEVECDVPTFEEWTYDEHGRRPPEHPRPGALPDEPPAVVGIRGAASEGGGQSGCGAS